MKIMRSVSVSFLCLFFDTIRCKHILIGVFVHNVLIEEPASKTLSEIAVIISKGLKSITVGDLEKEIVQKNILLGESVDAFFGEE